MDTSFTGTTNEFPTRRVFLITGWRRWLMQIIFGTFAAGALLLMIDDDPAVRGAGALVAVIMAVMAAFGEWLMRFTRLVVSADGIDLRQLGYRLQAPWTNVADFYGQSGHQGFILHQPLTGKGADGLAFASDLGFKGVPIYDDAQRSLLAQRRFIPIEAFSAHLTRGALIDAVRRHAPALADAMRDTSRWQQSASPADPQSRRRSTGLKVALIVALILASVWIGLTEPPWINGVLNALLAVAMVPGALAGAASTLRAWRRRQFFWCVLFAAQAIICAMFGLIAVLRLIAMVH